MDNLENYLYILFAVIYIISRLIKARSKQQQQENQSPRQREARPAAEMKQQDQPQRKKAFSFEDIIKEFEKNLAGDEEQAFEKPLPVKEIRHAKPAAVVKAPKLTAKNPYEAYEGSDFTTVDQGLDPKKETEFSRSEKYSIKGNITSEYIKMLKDPEGFKNAIVLSEIINRKYF